MAAIGHFDANHVPPAAQRDVIPEGWYNVMISKSELKQTSDKTGYYAELVMQVMDGPYQGAELIERLNLQNRNPVAVEIAQRTLSAICHATHVLVVNDTAQLHSRPMQAKVIIRPAGAGNDGRQYEASNEIRGYKPYGGGTPGNQTPSQPAGLQIPPQPFAGTPPPPVPMGYQPQFAAGPAPVPNAPQGFQHPTAPSPNMAMAPAAYPSTPPVNNQPPFAGQAPQAQAGFVPSAPPFMAPAAAAPQAQPPFMNQGQPQAEAVPEWARPQQ